MSDIPAHQKNWLQNINPKPAGRSPAETVKQTVLDLPCNMSPYEIINRIHDGRLTPNKSLFTLFVAKAKLEPEGPMKTRLRKLTALTFKDYVT